MCVYSIHICVKGLDQHGKQRLVRLKWTKQCGCEYTLILENESTNPATVRKFKKNKNIHEKVFLYASKAQQNGLQMINTTLIVITEIHNTVCWHILPPFYFFMHSLRAAQL